MFFVPENLSTLLAKMEITHTHTDNSTDYAELEGALLDIAGCMRLVSERALEAIFAPVDKARASHYRRLHGGLSGWDKAIHAPARINALCVKYGGPEAFRGGYNWRRHDDELLQMLRALIAE